MAPSIKQLVSYVPSKDFEMSKRFYAALGFTLTDAWGGTMDCSLGGAIFRLQDYYVKDWAENFMMKFDVEDIEGWHAHAKSVIDGGEFGDARYEAEIERVGVDTKLFHVHDPCGVLLIFVQ